METPLLSFKERKENVVEGKMSTRRSELEVKMDILRVVGEGWRKPTQIMYKANLSWSALQEHFKSLVNAGLLREEKFAKRSEYDITPPGITLLNDYRKLTASIKRTVVEIPSF